MTPPTSNVLFGWPIYSDVGVLYTPTFAGGAWDANFPLTNLATRYLDGSSVARASSAALKDTRVRADLKTDRAIRVVGIPKHTLSSAAYVRVLGVPSTMLFDYEAGDDVTALSGTFTRGSAATYVDRNGVLRSAASGELRDSHFIGGLRHTLLEAAGTNLCIRSEDFSSWTNGGATVSVNAIAAPDGATTADKVSRATSNSDSRSQVCTFTGNATKVVSIYVKAGTATQSQIALYDGTAAAYRHLVTVTWTAGVPTIASTTGSGTLYAVEALGTTGWYRLSFSAASVVAANTNSVFVYPSSNGTGTEYIYAWGAQVEDATFRSSYIATAAATVTRSADNLSFPFTAIPQEMTVYLKGVERGSILSAVSPRLFQISSAADGDPRFFVSSTGSAYRATHDPASQSTSTAAAAPSVGDTVEIRALLSPAGAATIGQSINAAAEVVASAGGAQALAGAWSDTKLYLNSAGTAGSTGWFAFQSLRIAAGTKTLAEMQAMVYDSGWVASYPSGHTAETLQGMNVAFVQIVNGQTGFTGQYWSVQIDDASNSAGYVELARLCVCGGWQPDGNAQYGLEQRWDSPTTAEETDAASFIYNARPGRRLFAYTLPMMLDADTLSYPWRMQRILGKSGQFLFVFDPTDSANMHERACLCVFEDLSPLKYAFLGRQDVPLGIREEL